MKTFLVATVATFTLAAPALAQNAGTLNVWGARLDAPAVIVLAPQRAPDVLDTGSVPASSQADRLVRRPTSHR